MSDENTNDQSADFKTPFFSASLKGKDVQLRDIVGVIILVLVALSGYVWWEHKNEASAAQKTTHEILKEGQRDLSFSLKELAQSQRDMVSAQREANCLSVFPENIRESRAQWCKQITR
jgi:hypothetical protein